VNRILLPACVLALVVSCKTKDGAEPESKEPTSNSSTISASPTTPSTVKSASAQASGGGKQGRLSSDKVEIAASQKTLSPDEKKRLKMVFNILWCLQSKNDRSGFFPALKKGGYEDIATWGLAWHQASQIDPVWVDSVVAAVSNLRCDTPSP